MSDTLISSVAELLMALQNFIHQGMRKVARIGINLSWVDTYILLLIFLQEITERMDLKGIFSNQAMKVLSRIRFTDKKIQQTLFPFNITFTNELLAGVNELGLTSAELIKLLRNLIESEYDICIGPLGVDSVSINSTIFTRCPQFKAIKPNNLLN